MGRALLLLPVAVATGLGMGVAAASVGRWFNLLFLDGAIIGLFGGSVLLFFALWRHIHPGRLLALSCLFLAASGIVGLKLEERRTALRSGPLVTGDATLDALSETEVAELVGPDRLEELRAERAKAFETRILAETGRGGLWGFFLWQTGQGVVAWRLFGSIVRLPLPRMAAILGMTLSLLLAALLAWIVLRRLGWLPTCRRCGRYLIPPSASAAPDAAAEPNPGSAGASEVLAADPEALAAFQALAEDEEAPMELIGADEESVAPMQAPADDPTCPWCDREPGPS